MLSIRGLRKSFAGHEVLLGFDLDIAAGEVIGMIGRSGSGKSTLARCLVGLEKPGAGTIHFDGLPLVPGQGRGRRRIQYLWQDPAQSLSPYLSALESVAETLVGFGLIAPQDAPVRAKALLCDLGLPEDAHLRRPHALSGGQCQRTALARAIAAEPDLLILDEPLSSLDLPSQIDLVGLLSDLHASRGVAMLIVSHDLAPLLHLADRIVVLDQGICVENLAARNFARDARHPLSRGYTEKAEPF